MTDIDEVNKLIKFVGANNAEKVGGILETWKSSGRLYQLIKLADHDGNYPLHKAAKRGFDAILQKLLEAKAPINAQDADGNTAFMLAIKTNKRRCATILKDAKADITIVNKAGKTAAQLCQDKYVYEALFPELGPYQEPPKSSPIPPISTDDINDGGSKGKLGGLSEDFKSPDGVKDLKSPASGVPSPTNLSFGSASISDEDRNGSDNSTRTGSRQPNSNENDAQTQEILKIDMFKIYERMSRVEISYFDLNHSVKNMGLTIDQLVAKEKECPNLVWFYPKERNFRDWLNKPFENFLTNSYMLVFICPVTLRAVKCGPNGVGWEVNQPKEWFRKWGPAIVTSLKVLKIALAVGRIAGIPLPSLPSASDLGVNGLVDSLGLGDKASAHLSNSLNKMFDNLWQDARKEGFDWAKKLGKNALTSELEYNVNNPKEWIPQEVTGEAYRQIHAFLTSGDNLKLGPLAEQLEGSMKRVWSRETGAMDWVSLEGENEWYRQQALQASASVGVDGVKVEMHRVHIYGNGSIAQEDIHITHDKLTEELKVLMHAKFHPVIKKCVSPFLEQYIYDTKSFFGLEESVFDEIHVKIEGHGLRQEMKRIYLENHPRQQKEAQEKNLIDEVDRLKQEIAKLKKRIPDNVSVNGEVDCGNQKMMNKQAMSKEEQAKQAHAEKQSNSHEVRITELETNMANVILELHKLKDQEAEQAQQANQSNHNSTNSNSSKHNSSGKDAQSSGGFFGFFNKK